MENVRDAIFQIEAVVEGKPVRSLWSVVGSVFWTDKEEQRIIRLVLSRDQRPVRCGNFLSRKGAAVSVKHELRKLLWKFGYDLSRFEPGGHPVARKKQLLKAYGIDLVLDVGANDGDHAQKMRIELDYHDRIVSFEPMSRAFRSLSAKAERDTSWEVFQLALGNKNGKETIHVAGNSYSSSILNMLPSHVSAAPESKYLDQEIIEIRTLDSLWDEVRRDRRNVFLKIDTQGYEHKVLKGADKALNDIDSVQMEMSLVPLYEGELLFHELNGFMTEKGYQLVALDPAFINSKNGQVLQIDGFFHRER